MTSTTHLPIGLHFGITEEVYRADFGLNQSLLKAFGSAKSPLHFRDRPPKEETDSLRIGNYVDWATFCPHTLGQRVAVWPGERKGNDWKAFKFANKDKTILNNSEYERALGAATAIAVHDDAQKILKVCNYQVAAIAQHPLGFRMKGLLDLAPDPARCHPLLLDYVFDLKTADDASTEGFALACYKWGYDVQAAFYMDILDILEKRENRHFGFIVVENEKPHAVKIHYLSNDSREIRRARERYQSWAIAYLDCLKHDRWNGYSESWSEITFKPWMLRDEGYGGEELQ